MIGSDPYANESSDLALACEPPVFVPEVCLDALSHCDGKLEPPLILLEPTASPVHIVGTHAELPSNQAPQRPSFSFDCGTSESSPQSDKVDELAVSVKNDSMSPNYLKFYERPFHAALVNMSVEAESECEYFQTVHREVTHISSKLP